VRGVAATGEDIANAVLHLPERRFEGDDPGFGRLAARSLVLEPRDHVRRRWSVRHDCLPRCSDCCLTPAAVVSVCIAFTQRSQIQALRPLIVERVERDCG
jgi:hypothetical protein